ncbi:GerAB/ArcD/ProY family transporter [Clostridium thailandense]|uniref:GerAB/ArcD/ProY family transporter n=1 Tax=Clostridium thailandense TaxID=2794346 RepID=UPI0039896574
MKIEKGIISNTELMFLIIGLLQGSTLTAAFISGIIRQNTWIVLLTGFITTLILLLVYTSLSQKYPGRNLIEINSGIYGCYFGKIVSILYIFYFWFIVPANLRYIADFFSIYLFPDTDIIVFIMAITIVCIYTLRKGLEVIARVGFILTMMTIVAAILITIFTIKNIRLNNFLPLFQIDSKEFIQGTNLMVCIPFGEIIVFLMIFPRVNDIKQVRRSALWGLIVGTVYFLSIILENTAILGNIGSIHAFPSYQVAKLINIGEIITRMETLIAVMLLFNVFLKTCLFYYATVLSVAQFFKLRSYRALVIPVGIINIVLAIIIYNSPVDQAYGAANIYPIYAIPFIILFPIASLLIAHVRNTV